MLERVIFSGAGGQGLMFIGKLFARLMMERVPYLTLIPSYGAEVRGGGAAHVMTGEAPETINDFGKEGVSCRTESLERAGARFTYELPALAHAVLELEIA